MNFMQDVRFECMTVCACVFITWLGKMVEDSVLLSMGGGEHFEACGCRPVAAEVYG